MKLTKGPERRSQTTPAEGGIQTMGQSVGEGFGDSEAVMEATSQLRGLPALLFHTLAFQAGFPLKTEFRCYPPAAAATLEGEVRA